METLATICAVISLLASIALACLTDEEEQRIKSLIVGFSAFVVLIAI